jgi:hypothetical protein
MPIESLIDLIMHFMQFPSFPVDSDLILPASIHIDIPKPNTSIRTGAKTGLSMLGSVFVGLIGASVAALLYQLPSRETVLVPQTTGVVRSRRVGHELAAAVISNILVKLGVARQVSTDVIISAFAPLVVMPGDDFYIQIILHSPEQLSDAQSRAEYSDKGSSHLHKSMPLLLPIATGDEIRITIDGCGAEIRDPDQTFVWRQDHPFQVAFPARLPTRFGDRQYKPIVRVFVNGTPAGIMVLCLGYFRVSGYEVFGPVVQKALRFKKVFMSYASPDLDKVLEMAKMLTALRVDFFQDFITLKPGERWERRIYEEIPNCDAFCLFWSSNAKNSEWVIKEAVLALKYHKESEDGLPYISPVIIEGPPIPKPPPELNELQFNDPSQYIIFAHKKVQKKSDKTRQNKRSRSERKDKSV